MSSIYSSSMHSDLFFSLLTGNHDVARPILNTVEWSQEAIDALQRIYLESPQGSYCTVCSHGNYSSYLTHHTPSVHAWPASVVYLYNSGNTSLWCIYSIQNGSGFIYTNNDEIPNADQCPYVSPDICTGEPGSQGRCCSQLGSGSTTLSQLSTLAVLFIVLSISLF